LPKVRWPRADILALIGIVVAAVGSAAAIVAIPELHDSVFPPTEPKKLPSLALVDSYLDQHKQQNIKLSNTGSGDALICAVRLLRYDSQETVCSAVLPDKVQFPLIASYKNSSTIQISEGRGAEVPPDLQKALEKIERPDTSLPLDLSPELKVGEAVPAGGTAWLQIAFLPPEPKIGTDQRLPTSCQIIVTPYANAVVYYNSVKYVISPRFELPAP
jgi:hypothetical protein